MPLPRFLDPLWRPDIATSRDVRRYVVLVTAAASAITLAVDVANQLIFFESWTTALRSWALTIASAVITAVPISLMIARAQRDLHQVKRDIEAASRTDVLTGLPNRRALMERVERHEERIMILLIVDIDRFKLVNDTHGHRAGDAVITAVGRMMAAQLAGCGFVARLGGEEFAVLACSRRAAEVLASVEGVRRQLAATPPVFEGTAIRVTICAGAAASLDGEPFDRLYTEADEALYRAKASGRDRIELSPRLRELEGGEALAGAGDAA